MLTNAPDRFRLLLDWINDDDWIADDVHDRVSRKEVRDRIRTFIESFDGSEQAGFLRAELFRSSRPSFIPTRGAHEQPIDEREELTELHFLLEDLLKRGFPPEPGYEPAAWSELVGLSSLAYGMKREAPIRFGKGAKDRKWWKGRPGACVSVIAGNRSDLVQFLVMHLLRLPGGVTLARCAAPAPNAPTRRCGRFVLTAGRGRPREFCVGNACKKRHHDAEVKRRKLRLSDAEFAKWLVREEKKKDKNQQERMKKRTASKRPTASEPRPNNRKGAR